MGIRSYEERVATQDAMERQNAAIQRIRMQRLIGSPESGSPQSRTVYAGRGGYVPRTTETRTPNRDAETRKAIRDAGGASAYAASFAPKEPAERKPIELSDPSIIEYTRPDGSPLTEADKPRDTLKDAMKGIQERLLSSRNVMDQYGAAPKSEFRSARQVLEEHRVGKDIEEGIARMREETARLAAKPKESAATTARAAAQSDPVVAARREQIAADLQKRIAQLRGELSKPRVLFKPVKEQRALQRLLEKQASLNA